MIEQLDGIFETVNYKDATTLKLYYNNENENYPSHWHMSCEIIMPTDNIYTIETPEKTVTLRKGDIAIICPGCIHALYAPEVGERIIFQPDISALKFMSEIETLITTMSPLLVITPKEYPSIYNDLYQNMLDIKDIYFNDNTYIESKIYAKFLYMLTLIGQNIHLNISDELFRNNAKREEYFEKFIEICNYINDHCAEELSLDDVANKCGFSKFYFSKLFKQFANVSFYKYVNHKRIAKAETLLLNPKNSITDVALKCGFSSLSPFIRMFKLIKGCTPTEFRKMYRSNSTKYDKESTFLE